MMGLPELALNHVNTYNFLIKELGLDKEVAPLNSLLIAKKEVYAKLSTNKRKTEPIKEKRSLMRRLPF